MPQRDGPVGCFCEVAQLSYLEAGSGDRAVVLLHGWGAFKEIWWSTLLALSPHARAFAPDMPGHGDSPLAGAVRMDSIAQRIDAFCTARGLKTVMLVGHSMGGNVAAELALLRPELIERLVLVDPAILTGELRAFAAARQREAGWAALRMGQALARALDGVIPPISHTHGGGIVRPALRRARYGAQHDPDNLVRLLDGLAENHLAERLHMIQIPTMVISGWFDTLVPRAHSRRVAAAIPGARYVTFRLASHNPMDERPQQFQRVLLDFLC